tara:strand:- start:896 stop:2125 length:1230 start_codon:yes stop_codon:yes gene_type:complete
MSIKKQDMNYEKLYEYYLEQEVLPNYGSFKSSSDLDSYEQHRLNLFTGKLYLPKRLFQKAQLIEFGPSSGENSLAFARWGADCTLIEPNPKAHSSIRDYFKKFELSHKLVALKDVDLKSFSESSAPSKKFDFIDAEGFIYTVRPESLWIDLFARLVNDEGFVIIDYYETFGSFMELFLKVIYARVRQLTGLPAMEVTKNLFNEKWNSIPHGRPMEAWNMDVLENPFVRLRYFFEPQWLCKQMFEKDLHLYSSWPPYKDSLNQHWVKKTFKVDKHLHLQNEFISQSRLSHLFGRKHFLVNPDPVLEKDLKTLLKLNDSLIDNFEADKAAQCIKYFSTIAEVINSNKTVSEPQDKSDTLDTIKSIQHIFRLLAAGDATDIIKFCNSDQSFIKSWGMPSHFAIFRKENLVRC